MSTDSGMAGNPGPLGTYSDAARRVSDAITLHLLADGDGNFGKWCAFRLSDGDSDGVVYDDPVTAADHQLHYKQCAYIQIHRAGLSAKGAQVMLNYYRAVYDAGNVPPTLVAFQRAKLLRPGRNN